MSEPGKAAHGSAGARFHMGVGGTFRDAATGPYGRRSDSGSKSANRPCITRMIPPFADDVAGPNRAGYFNQYNQGKRSITLNLAQPAGLKVVYDLVLPLRCSRGEFRRRRCGEDGTGLRQAARISSRPRDDLDVGLWAEWALSQLSRLRTAGRRAIGIFQSDGI